MVVETQGLTKVFKDFWGRPKARAVNDLDLAVGHGQVFGLLGPNGSGKSTTVKLLLGLLYPTRGSVRVLGESPTRVATKRRVGYLPEESYLYRYLTARETLDFFGALFRIPPEERKRRCDQLLDMVGLSNARDRAVGEFSKGMARRIGLAQALINDPDLVILDEPTSGLDPIGCREVKDLIRLLAGRGKTVVLCSHLLADVEDVCDEVVILYGGKVRAQGSLSDILTVKDRTRITAPRLDPSVLQRVLEILREHAGEDSHIEVDQPSVDLEEFFLDVVSQAKAASLETAGAQSGGRIASYLHGEDEASAQAKERLLSALAGEQSEVEPESAESEAAQPGVPETEKPEPDADKLASLVPDEGRAAPAGPPPSPDDSDQKKEAGEREAEASERLRDLLSEGEKQKES